MIVDRQACSVSHIDRLFAHASKKDGSNSKGYPDFIITSEKYPSLIILVECKASNEDHEKAIQEVAHYAKFTLSSGYNTVIIAVSGTTESTLKIDTGIVLKNGTVIAGNIKGYNAKALLRFQDYQDYLENPFINPELKGTTKKGRNKEKRELTEFEQIIQSMVSIQDSVNNTLYMAGNLNADRRMLILSACLLGLRNQSFRSSYNNYQNNRLLNKLLGAVKDTLEDCNIPMEKVNIMMDNFRTLEQIEVLVSGIADQKGNIIYPVREVLDAIHIGSINNKGERIVNSKLRGILEGTIQIDGLNLDVMGNFYNEFITQGNKIGDAKNGFVLTPRHICELFAELGDVNKDTKILDICFGTGGCLIAGMKKAVEDANGDAEAIRNIKEHNIYGVELNGDRFTYGCVNMLLRGGGQDNLEQGDCFNDNIKQLMKSKGCEVGFINPPYALPTSELLFVENMLDCLVKDGRGIAILPMSCATNKNSNYTAIKERILSKHTLEAVLSMPEQLFYPSSSVITCVMVFKAHRPHSKKTWFANCKDDGLVIDRKSKGRADINNRWAEIRNQWVNAFVEQDTIKGFSTKQQVTAKDEWTYEAYAHNDFSTLKEESFKKVVKEYAIHQITQL